MGLDMYLYKKTYVKNWKHNPPEEQHKITVLKGGKPRTDIKPERITYLEEEVAYWRKFNALHSWFVANCANGLDDCQEIYIGEDKLEDVLNLLKKVQEVLNSSQLVKKVVKGWNGEDEELEIFSCEDEVKELLSPEEGFFFGSTEIDKWYKEDVDSTVTLLENLLKEEGNGEYYYRASW